MKENKLYLVTGTFVIIATVIMLGVWLWMESYSHQAYNTYVAVFHESVDGVSISSVVKYNGVEVGKVKQIELDTKDPRNIRVYLNVLDKVRIKTETYAVIKPQGITGLSYISLSLGQNDQIGTDIIPTNEPPYPEIRTRASLLSSLTDQAQSIAGNVNDVSAQMKIFLNDKNIEHAANLLANLDKVSSAIAKHSDDISKSLSTLSQILTDVKKNSENLNQTFVGIKDLTYKLSNTTDNANKLINNADGLIVDIQSNTLQNVNAVLLPNLNSTIEHLDQSSYQLEQLLRLLNQNPAALVRGKSAARLGPGE